MLLLLHISYKILPNMNDYEGIIWKFIHGIRRESLLLGILFSIFFIPCYSVAILKY